MSDDAGAPLRILTGLAATMAGWQVVSHCDYRAMMRHDCGAVVRVYRARIWLTGRAATWLWVCGAGAPAEYKPTSRQAQRTACREHPRLERAVAWALHDLAGSGLPMRAMRDEAWAMVRRGGA